LVVVNIVSRLREEKAVKTATALLGRLRNLSLTRCFYGVIEQRHLRHYSGEQKMCLCLLVNPIPISVENEHPLNALRPNFDGKGGGCPPPKSPIRCFSHFSST